MTFFRCAVFWGCDHTAFTRKLAFAPPLPRIACTPLTGTCARVLLSLLSLHSLHVLLSRTCTPLSHMCSSLKNSICSVETELDDRRREKRECSAISAFLNKRRREKRECHHRLNSRTEVFRGYVDQVITSKRLFFVKIRKL